MPRPRTAIVSLLAALFFSGRGIGQETDLTQGAFRNPPPSHANAANSSDNERQVVPEKQAKPAASDVISFDEVMARVAERERDFNDRMQRVHPIIETYIQNLRDVDIGPVPISDRYFLGKLDLGGKTQESFKPGDDSRQSVLAKLNVFPKLARLYGTRFLATGFAQMVVLDPDFQTKYYDFEYVRREFLGDIRCMVVDVHPKPTAGDGRFVGRIWVEDREYNIVRFNGTYHSDSGNAHYFHFESWRLNLQPHIWLPAYVYSEESRAGSLVGSSLHFRAQIRLWGYDLAPDGDKTFTKIKIDPSQQVIDMTNSLQSKSPVEGTRLWAREAEDNTLERLQKAGLLAPPGEVEKVVQTVIDNLIATNNLTILPEVRARLLLTTPLESFTVGHTIVLSRGLLDVLPDEPSLAMVLAHELAHIALDQHQNTGMAFNDRMFFPDQDTFEHLDFARNPAEEEAADRKALTFLSNSPYKEKLDYAGLFLRQLGEYSAHLKSLIQPHLGDRLAEGDTTRMSALLGAAPALEPRSLDQIAALPLGSRIKLDPWSSRTELAKGAAVSLTTPREKMPFAIAPIFPHLSRIEAEKPTKVAATAIAP